ncbi:MAG: OsmC family protein [Bacteroidia bacterium]|jgi:uncharacterized OsmC-like protein|nr:OsmC family protein [Bacteroidia bacterium]
MSTSKVKYAGDLRTEAVHLASGKTIITDAPVDNHGKGQAFSPTDLLCTCLASCMLTLMGIATDTYNRAAAGRQSGTEKHNPLNIDGALAEVTKIMASNPRRVGEIQIIITMPPVSYTAKEKQILENAARTCPVAMSINPSIVLKVEFIYPAETQNTSS